MENASKALVMAAGVLIGVLLLSLAVYLFADFGATSARINAQNAEKQLIEFNSKFTSYEGFKDKDGNWKITIYDIISLASYAKEYNKFYEGTTESKINVSIGNTNISSKTEDEYKELINTYVDSTGIIKKFRCSGISYNDKGRVEKIKFDLIT